MGTIYMKLSQYFISILFIHNNLANIYLNKRLYDEAIKEYQITVKLKPDSPDIELV